MIFTRTSLLHKISTSSMHCATAAYPAEGVAGHIFLQPPRTQADIREWLWEVCHAACPGRWRWGRWGRAAPVRVAMWSLLVVLALCAARAGTRAADLDVAIGVVEQQPVRAQQLAAAVEAALDGGRVDVEPVEPDEALALAAHVCAQAAAGAAAVVAGGRGGARAAALAQAGAARAGLPLLLVDAAPAPAPPTWEALALYPHPDVLAKACADLCREKGWRRAVLLHEGSARGAALLAPDSEPLALLARQLPPRQDNALLRNLLLVLKKFGLRNFIVWCSAECSVRVLDAAQRVGLLSERHSYLVLSLDLHTQPLEDYSHGGANITGLRLFDPESNETINTMVAWQEKYLQRLGREADEELAASVARAPPTALLLAHTGASLAAAALRRLELPHADLAAAGDCERGTGAFHADTLLNYLRSEEWSVDEGRGGGVSWEADGGRREVQLQVVELARGGRLQAAGRWSPRAGVTWHRDDPPSDDPPPDSMTNRTFTVLIAPSRPYIMRQESTTRLSGNDRYEGFCIELIDRLAKLLSFNYTFVEQPDGAYGVYDPDKKEWNGMMRRLRDDDSVHFAITDLTITSEREQAVDFTTPFMNLGIGILFRTPKAPEPELFAFLLPFSNGVWLCLGFAYLGTSLLLYVVGRLCHEEWQNPYPCIEDPPALENQFTLGNALWFNLGAVLLQGSEIAPVAYGTRAVASVWWLFALVITSSYTANLATLLAKKTSSELIHNVDELANNDLGITYGAKAGGSTYTFFENSKSTLYKKMAEHMKGQKMPQTNEEGIKKVMNEDYAFLMESTSIEYVIERNCDVTKVGGLLDSKGYGIAMRKDSPYRQAMNLALLNLQEAGILREMKYKWWKEKHGGGACKEVDDRESTELSMRNFLGLFLVLVVGCALGIVVSCCDLAWAAARRPRDPSQPFTRRLWAELRFVFRFEQSVKPLQGSLSLPSSESEPSESPGCEEPLDEETDKGTRLRSTSASARGAAGGGAASGAAGGTGASTRRRSSMYAANARLARHARDSTTPAPAR